MGKSRFTSDQVDWIKKQLKTKAPYEVLEELNQKYAANMTASEFKSWRMNHKVKGIRKNPKAGKSILFNEKQIQFILEHYKEWESPVIASKMNEQMGTNFTGKQIRTYRHNHNLFSNLKGCWNENRPNPHKGEKGWYVPNSESTRFTRETAEYNKEPLFTISIRRNKDKRRYKWIKTGDKEWQLYHIYLWEKAYGPLKPGEKLKFLNNNSLDCRLENLMIFDNQIQGKLCRKNYISNNPEITKAAILVSKLNIKLNTIEGDQNGK